MGISLAPLFDKAPQRRRVWRRTGKTGVIGPRIDKGMGKGEIHADQNRSGAGHTRRVSTRNQPVMGSVPSPMATIIGQDGARRVMTRPCFGKLDSGLTRATRS